MVDTGYASFSATVDKTNRVLREIEEELGWPKERRAQSYAALRVVLHAVRDRLTVDEAAQVAAQLPLLIRGVYYDGWDPSRVPQKMSSEEFFQRIRRDFRYDVEGGVSAVIGAVTRSLRHHVTDGEWQDITSSLPRELSTLLA
jgi:uncharacterized protein (DUF2267 family)